MVSPTHTIVETPAFAAQARKLGISAEELSAIYDVYASTPDYGDVIRETGGLRKGRVAKDETGKSGGYRMFSFFANRRHPAFLIWIIDKTKDDTLSDEQKRKFRSVTTQLKTECK